MKTKYKIILLSVTIIFSILVIPPNLAAFSCNTLKIKDAHCHIVGMTFFDIDFDTSIYHWFGWEDTLPCGGINADPEKTYFCYGFKDYWGYPEKIDYYSKLDTN